MTTTIAYLTNRQRPMIEWFFRSLHRELQGDYRDIRIVVVDLHASQPGRREHVLGLCLEPSVLLHVEPKPTPWQGKHRLTDQDYFAAANARNTALCWAPDGYLVFVDDLSFLIHGWWNAVCEHRAANRIVAGAYRKVKEVRVDEAANLTYWLPSKIGMDGRWIEGRTGPVPCTGQSLFGCSFGIPVETMLQVNGFDEALDGLSFEDVCFGLRLDKLKQEMVYDQRMLTFESEELHNQPDSPALPRVNRPIEGFQDCAWEMLDWIAKQGDNSVSRGTIDLRVARNEVLNGGEFHVPGFFIWPDGKNLLGE